MQQPHRTYTVDEARARLERYCAMEDRCHKQAEEKLREMNMIPEAVDQILYHLLTNNYLNEERFARTFARSKFNQKQWGKNRIIRELKMRDISKFNIDAALTEIEDKKYYEIFDTLSRKRLAQINKEPNKYKKRKKLADYLLYRGWPSDWIYEKAKELIP